MLSERALIFLCSKLVHIADNVQQKPTYICCGCCCGQLSAINQWDLPAVAPSGFLPTHAEDACTGCSRCARACPISAISMDAMRMQGQSKNALKPVVNTDRCIGCGVCAIACPKAAMSLERCGERRPVPKNAIEKSIRMAMERGRLAHLIVDAQALGEKPDRGRTTPGQRASEIAAQADSIEELERALEIPAPALQNTITVYNDYAKKRADPFFRKAAAYLRPLEKPPFSAVKASVGEGLFAFFTLGGLHVSPRSEVLDKQGDPIAKLYAAGRATAGIPSLHSASYLSGLSLSECLTFGRIAGANAAKG